ncbi:MAG: sulfurtransferase [Gemmatimonadaceae bacterium]
MRRLPLLFSVVLFAPLAAWSQASGPQPLAPAAPDPRSALFVSVEWLAQHLRDPNLVLLHVGDPAEYPATHLPGGRLVNLADISVGDRTGKGLALEMPSADTLRARLVSLGISDGSRMVLYYGKDWVSPTTRVHLTLAYAGLGDHASILDGGMAAWTAAGHATTTEVPAPAVGALSPLRVRNFVVDAAYVQSMIGKPGVSIVDARDTAFYAGSRSGGSPSAPHRAGHIASARSVPFSTLTDASLRVKSPAELAAAFAAAGVGPRDVIIGYCHIGQQATAMLTAARALGHPILLYDGSFQDWSARVELPVETGARRPNDD